jgi:hypothetical protein
MRVTTAHLDAMNDGLMKYSGVAFDRARLVLRARDQRERTGEDVK